MNRRRSEWTRREFLRRSAAGLGSVGLAGGGGWTSSPLSARSRSDGGIIYRTLGRTGIRLPIVSMGVMNANNPELIPRSYEAGVRLFDTAMGYQNGRNEEMVGSAIEKMGVRDEVVIVTKIPAPGSRRRGTTLSSMGKESVKRRYLENFNACLKRLRTDYVDVLLLHNNRTAEAVHNPGVMDALSQLKREGRVRFIGVSTHSGQDVVLNEVARTDFYDVVLFAFNFTMADNTAIREATERVAAKGLGLIAMKTQGGGRRRKSLGPISETAALKWVLRHEQIATAIPGYTNFEHMAEDFSVARGLELTEEERAFLESKDIREAMGFCQQCRQCVGTCPRGADISALMRGHMYAVQYANFHQARAALEEVPEEEGLAACSTCTACSARCVHSIDIAHAIRELKSIYA